MQPSFDSYSRLGGVRALTVEGRPARRPCKARDGAEHNEAMRVFSKNAPTGQTWPFGWHGDATRKKKKSQNWKLERQFTVDLLISKQAHLGEYDNFERATLESFSEPSGFTDSFGSPVSAKRNLMKFQVCCILFPLISPLPLLRGAERMPAKQINSKS